jgi:hypothetical protein
MRAASYWGLERRYGKALFAPPVTRGGYLARGNEKLIEKVRSYISK